MFLNFEFYILDLISVLKCGILDHFMTFVTTLGDSGFIWILLGVVLTIFKKTRKEGITVLLALLLGFIICNIILKPIIARTRPFDIRDVALIIPRPSDFSFPSGHSTSSFAAATAIFLSNRKYGKFALVFALLVAFSRLYLGVHFPTDVIFGSILGAGSAYTVHLIMKKVNI